MAYRTWIDLEGHTRRPAFASNRNKVQHNLFSWCPCGNYTEVNELPAIDPQCSRCKRRARNKWRREVLAKLRARGYK